ncbi:LOW QUALITY PROTEIN: protein stoned-B-like [Prorops nasuta]|uniref:LOW QUALITY PROTEIN: protein stoned-B-like n=1 Tax=Prorops nasuta TaxID=863751 RepID=UPI0034CFB839
MHKLSKGLKKKKKSKKGKKGEEEEFDREELERYRRERAEAQQKAEEAGESGESGSNVKSCSNGSANAGSDEWKKFEALTAGVDSILKKTQGDLDRIKSTSFFQRKVPFDEEEDKRRRGKKLQEEEAASAGSGDDSTVKRWVGFDDQGNPVEAVAPTEQRTKKLVNEDGFVDIPDDEEEEPVDSADEDIFDTTYVDVLKNINVELAYIPDSPTEEDQGDDPFDTSNADKVLKTVDKKGKKLVTLGNAVEVLSGRIDHVSTCRLSKSPGRPRTQQDLLLDDFQEVAESAPIDETCEKTLLDDDTDLPDAPTLTTLAEASSSPPISQSKPEAPLDISEFDLLNDKTFLREIPDLDDTEDGDPSLRIDQDQDPFASKEPEIIDPGTEIVEASFEVATFVDEEDPFDTAFAENILPGKAELKFIERELEDLPSTSQVSISLTDPAGLNRDYETGLLKSIEKPKKDLLGGSATDLCQLVDQPIAPKDELTYVDPFDTSAVEDLPPGKAELKFLEKELLGEEQQTTTNDESDDDFDPRREETEEVGRDSARKASRPEALELTTGKNVAFELPTPSKKPDLLASTDEEKTLPSKPLTPYYSQKSLEEVLPSLEGDEEQEYEKEEEVEEADVDPFDTSFVAKAAPGKTELKLIESELLDPDNDFDPRCEEDSSRPRILELSETVVTIVKQESLLDDVESTKVDAKPLTPKLESTLEGEISYADPFDTSIASNILPGKAELKLLENELQQVTESTILPTNPIDLIIQKQDPAPQPELSTDTSKETRDFLCSDDQDPGAKVLTPLYDTDLVNASSEDIDPFDTSFAAIGPGKTELKFLESELIGKRDLKNTKMDSKSSNPFLMDDYAEETTPTAAPAVPAAPAAVSNPFLQELPDDTLASVPHENPFLNFVAEQPYEVGALDSTTNPFASFALDSGNDAAAAAVQEPEASFFVTSEETKDVLPEEPPEKVAVVPPTRPPPPPPPPRPQPPAKPTKNTKDLILSVTGALDATSNHLLDRLQATRTPSPTLMHSPSPTPEHSFADLLDVESNDVNDFLPDDNKNATTDILDLFDAPNTDVPCSNTLFGGPVMDAPAAEQENPFGSIVNEERVVTDLEEIKPQIEAETIVPSSTIDAPDSGKAPLYSSSEPQPETASFFAIPQVAESQATAFSSDLLGDFQGPANDTSLIAATTKAIESTGDAFDAFASKFDKAVEPEVVVGGDPFFDAFGGGQTAMDTSSDVWGDSSAAGSDTAGLSGFGETDGFDSFLSMTAPPQEPKVKRSESADSDEAPDFSVFIKPKEGDYFPSLQEGGAVPTLAPPPKSPQNSAYADSSPRFNPFDKSGFAQDAVVPPSEATARPEMTRTDTQETPPTPLFDDDVSQPLEDFPRITYTGDGWEMQLRQPHKKKITGQRFWKKIFLKLVYQGDSPVLQLFNKKDDKDPFQELPLLVCYSVSDIGAQHLDQYGKIFTVKLQYIFYKERPGVRPGQVTKAERITNKLSQFAAYAIQGDYQGVKEFGSDLKKLGLPVEHAPQISELLKLGSQCYEDLKQFSCAIEEALFRIAAQRDRALNYKMEEVQITVVDELYVEQTAEGIVERQIARVRLFFLGFLTGMPDVELGINDMWRQGKEVVGRHDIIPVVTEEWIRLENVEFHSCVQQDEYEKTRIIKFKPPDACYIELMRFRVRPPKNRELPLQLKAVMCVTGNKVELKADILVPGFASRKLGQVPCEDVMVRFPIPECWIYLFRVEKHFRYGSVKSAHRRTGKIKGIERFLGAVDTLEPQLMEVTSGQAKYEHHHHAIVWRMPRLPKEGQGAYTTHQMVCRLALTSYDQIPENLAEYCYVEFTMPATQVSHTTARSVSLQNSDSDAPPEKYVRNLSRHEYRVGIEHTKGEGPGAYVTATISKKIPEATPEAHSEIPEAPAESDSDSSE